MGSHSQAVLGERENLAVQTIAPAVKELVYPCCQCLLLHARWQALVEVVGHWKHCCSSLPLQYPLATSPALYYGLHRRLPGLVQASPSATALPPATTSSGRLAYLLWLRAVVLFHVLSCAAHRLSPCVSTVSVPLSLSLAALARAASQPASHRSLAPRQPASQSSATHRTAVAAEPAASVPTQPLAQTVVWSAVWSTGTATCTTCRSSTVPYTVNTMSVRMY